MKITFTQNVATVDSMIFENCYEPELAMSFEEKQDILDACNRFTIWMFVDNVLAGEAYGCRLYDLNEEIEGCDDLDEDTIYCYSTTILPEFQGKGFGKLLKAYWLGMCSMGYELVVGHSTSEKMKRLNELFGAVHSVEHMNWQGSKRTAWFYKLEL